MTHPRLHKRPKRTLQGLLWIYLLAAISVFVVRYNVSFRDTVEFAHQTLLEDEWGQLPHATSRRESEVFFVHAGKTGGTTIGKLLRVLCEARSSEDSKQYCLREWQDRHSQLQESQLSRRTKGFLHVTGIYPDDSILSDATHYLLSLRNPMERVVSWFYFLHPQNCFEVNGVATPRANFSLIDKACITKRRMDKQNSLEQQFYQDCFPTVDQFALALTSDNNCHLLAVQTLHGHGGPNGFAGHLWANYSYYARRMQSTKPILAVRTEHLWNDLIGVDQLLGGTGEVFEFQKHLDKKKKQYHKDQLSPEAYFSLCCALQDELKVYQELLLGAVNLEKTDRDNSLVLDVYQNCGGSIYTLKELEAACREQFP